ncbi:MAG: VanZ family protein [Planctomycetota bacterium]|jgi:hypothetical protein
MVLAKVNRGFWFGGWLLGVALITLVPVPGTATAELAPWCLTCGSFSLADALLNYLLFVPGGVWAARRLGGRKAVLLLLMLSLTIELAQLAIPGRFATLADVLCNTAGAATGALFSRPRPSATGLAAVALALLGAPGILQLPSTTDATYYGQWTPSLGHYDVYEGRVISAEVGSIPIPTGANPESGLIAKLLRTGGQTNVRFVVGSPPNGLAPVFAVFDENQKEVLILLTDGQDLRFRTRSLAHRLRLKTPSISLVSVLDSRLLGDTASVRFARLGTTACATTQEREVCGKGPGLGIGWSYLIGSLDLHPSAASLVGLVWLGAIGFLLGFAPVDTSLILGTGLLSYVLAWWHPFLDPALVEPLALVTGGALAKWLGKSGVSLQTPPEGSPVAGGGGPYIGPGSTGGR